LFSHLAATIANSAGAKKSSGQPFSMQDMMLQWSPPEITENPFEAAAALLKSIHRKGQVK
jgi:hypothetical protein